MFTYFPSDLQEVQCKQLGSSDQELLCKQCKIHEDKSCIVPIYSAKDFHHNFFYSNFSELLCHILTLSKLPLSKSYIQDLSVLWVILISF